MKKGSYDAVYFETLTTEQLEEMLDLGLGLPSRENKEAILRILEVLEKRENDAIVQKAWEEFQLYYREKGIERYDFDQAALEKEEARERAEKQEKRPSRRVSLSRVWSVGRVAVLSVAITLCTMVIVQAAGVNVFGALGEWTDNAFHFVLGTPSTKPTSEREAYIHEFQGRLKAAGIPEDLVPTWYPEGFAPGEFDSSPVEGELESVGCVFNNVEEDKHYTVGIDRYYNEEILNSVVVEKNNKDEVEQYTVNGRIFYIMLNNAGYTGTWTDGEFLIVIGGNLSKDEMKEIIDSIGG